MQYGVKPSKVGIGEDMILDIKLGVCLVDGNWIPQEEYAAMNQILWEHIQNKEM